MVVGLYVGFATVGVFAYWYIWYDWSEYGHPLVSYTQLSNWGKCPDFGSDPAYYGVYSPSFTTWAKNGGLDLSSDPCKYMTGKGKDTASTMSLSVLVSHTRPSDCTHHTAWQRACSAHTALFTPHRIHR